MTKREALGRLDELDLSQLAGCVLLDDFEDPLDNGVGIGAERETGPAAGLAVEAEAPRGDADDHVRAEPAIKHGASGVAEAAATTAAAGCPAQRQVEARRVGALVQIDELRQGHQPLTKRDRFRGVREGDAVPAEREGDVLTPARAGERVFEEAGLGQLPVLRKIDRLVFWQDDQPDVVDVREAREVVEAEIEEQRRLRAQRIPWQTAIRVAGVRILGPRDWVKGTTDVLVEPDPCHYRRLLGILVGAVASSQEDAIRQK